MCNSHCKKLPTIRYRKIKHFEALGVELRNFPVELQHHQSFVILPNFSSSFRRGQVTIKIKQKLLLLPMAIALYVELKDM